MKLRKQLFFAIYLYVTWLLRFKSSSFGWSCLWGFLVQFLLVWVFIGFQVVCFFFNKEYLYEVKSRFALIMCLLSVSGYVFGFLSMFLMFLTLYVFAGEVPKQVKVKKLKNLKTLDSKPGNNFRVKWTVF